MELVKSNATGLMCYQFKVACQCGCHKPGYVYDWPFMPCCDCDKDKKITVELYLPGTGNNDKQAERLQRSNQRTIEEHPDLLPQIELVKELKQP